LWVQQVVSAFAVASVGLALHVSVYKQSDADPGADDYDGESAAGAAGASPPLSEGGGVGVVFDLDRGAEMLA
jgi:hypothetical protein